MKTWETNLKNRAAKRNHHLFSSDLNIKASIFTSPCDKGVIRNGGRNGAKHGPTSLLHHFKKLNATQESVCFKEIPNGDTFSTDKSFDQMQQDEYKLISSHLSDYSIHLGGGHDHVFPFASALIEKYGHINIVNIDAHLDTRNDEVNHSGTPFRQLYQSYPEGFSLTQIGIQNSANTSSSFEKVKMNVVNIHDVCVEKISSLSFDKEGPLLLSIDCDGIDATHVPAVSALNPHGLNSEHLFALSEVLKKKWKSDQKLFCGIYEFNPLYDTLSAQGARYISYYLNHLIS
jgi:formiminoglutamase